MKYNKTTILKQCTQLIWLVWYLIIIILTLMPITDTNNNGENCIYVPNYDSIYQWFLNDTPCIFTLLTYIESYVVLFVLYGLFWFIMKILNNIYQKIQNKPLSINTTKQSIFKLFIIQTSVLIFGYWIYLIYISAFHITLSVSVLLLAFIGAILYIVPLMLIVWCLWCLKIFYNRLKFEHSNNQD